MKSDILKYAKDKFGSEPEYLWAKFPNYAVLRNKNNYKWYAVIMNVSKKKLGLSTNEAIDILNVKCDPIIIGSLLQKTGYFSAYHMNKNNWITILLDGSVATEEIFNLINLSFELTKQK